MSMIQILNNFHSNFISFLDELIELFPQEGDLILARVAIKDFIPKEELILIFIQKIIPYKQHIVDRDDDFFMNCDLLNMVDDASKVEKGKILWKSMDSDDRKMMWKWVDLFVLLSEQYQKIKIEK